MSHELRTPLNSIIGFSEIISEESFGPSGNRKYVEYAKDIRFAGQHLLVIINDILDLMKIEAGRRRIQPEWVDLADVFKEVDSLVGLTVSEKGLNMRFVCSEEVPRVWLDRVSIRQVLLNLIANSVKFTEAGGHIVVSAEHRPSAGLKISIVDDGVGIGQEDLLRILKPFEQARDTVLKTAEGTGLGLPLSKSLIQLNGGSFKIESTQGQGTRVEIEFASAKTRTDRDTD